MALRIVGDRQRNGRHFYGTRQVWRRLDRRIRVVDRQSRRVGEQNRTRDRDVAVSGRSSGAKPLLEVCVREINLAVNDVIEVGALASQDHFDLELSFAGQILLSHHMLDSLLRRDTRVLTSVHGWWISRAIRQSL